MKLGIVGLSLVSLLSFGVHAQMEGDAVGDIVCVVGFVMDQFCIDRGTLLDAPQFETLVNPEEHSVHCLIDVPPCVGSPFNILMPDGDVYTPGYYMTDNSILVDLAKDLGDCGDCNGGSISKGMRMMVTGVVAESDGDMHYLEPMEVMMADETTECPLPPTTEVEVEDGEIPPPAEEDENGPGGSGGPGGPGGPGGAGGPGGQVGPGGPGMPEDIETMNPTAVSSAGDSMTETMVDTMVQTTTVDDFLRRSLLRTKNSNH